MGRSKYPAELRERAVRMVAEGRASYGSEWAAIQAVATKLGIGTAETLRSWVRQAEVDAGAQVGVSSEEHAEIKRLKRELAELRRANEILKAASVVFAAELDRPPQRCDVHRRAPGSSRGRWPALGCRVDVRGAVRARRDDCPFDVLRLPGSDAERPGSPCARTPSARDRRDEQLKEQIAQVHRDNYGVYGARKIWLELNRQGIPVARCTVERLMGQLGLRGARRGRKVRTTRSDPAVARPPDRVHRNFAPRAPNQLWVADFSYVSTWSGMVYVAFVIDAYARRILGWRVATSMTTALVLDALDHAVWTRRRDGATDLAGLVHHSDAGSQYTSIMFTQRLAETGIDPSVGSVGDAYDNALAESVIGLFKTELINPGGPWRTAEQVEAATLHYVHWFNHYRLLEVNGDLPPIELEQTYYRLHHSDLAEAG